MNTNRHDVEVAKEKTKRLVISVLASPAVIAAFKPEVIELIQAWIPGLTFSAEDEPKGIVSFEIEERDD